MPLDPEIAVVLKSLEGMPPMERMSLAELRASVAPVALERRGPPSLGIPLRQYTPWSWRRTGSSSTSMAAVSSSVTWKPTTTCAATWPTPAVAASWRRTTGGRRNAAGRLRRRRPLDRRQRPGFGGSTERLILAGDSAGAKPATVTTCACARRAASCWSIRSPTTTCLREAAGHANKKGVCWTIARHTPRRLALGGPRELF